MAALDTEVVMEINEIRPGMSCMTREGAAYVLEVDLPNQRMVVAWGLDY